MKKYKLGSKLENQKQKFESRTRGLLSYWIACTKRRSAEDNSLVGLIENRARHASILTPRTISGNVPPQNSGQKLWRSRQPPLHSSVCTSLVQILFYHILSYLLSRVYPREGGRGGVSSSRKTQYFRFTTFPANICDPLRCSRRGKWVYKSVCCF